MLLCSFKSGRVWRESFNENLLKVRTVKSQISLGIVSIVLVILRYSDKSYLWDLPCRLLSQEWCAMRACNKRPLLIGRTVIMQYCWKGHLEVAGAHHRATYPSDELITVLWKTQEHKSLKVMNRFKGLYYIIRQGKAAQLNLCGRAISKERRKYFENLKWSAGMGLSCA